MARTVMAPGWSKKIDGVVEEKVMDKTAEAIADDAARFAPKNSGRLAASFGVVQPRKLTRWIGSSVFYQKFVEFGTAAHVIRARRGGGLWWPGQTEVYARVRHPGATAHPHLRPALYRKRSL